MSMPPFDLSGSPAGSLKRSSNTSDGVCSALVRQVTNNPYNTDCRAPKCQIFDKNDANLRLSNELNDFCRNAQSLKS